MLLLAIETWKEHGYAVVYLFIEFVIMIGIVAFLKRRK